MELYSPTLPCPRESSKQPRPSRPYRNLDFGRLDFNVALTIQKNILQEVVLRNAPDTLILCEHPPTITLGRLAKQENILVSPEYLAQNGIQFFNIDRGGEVTYHGPGQLVAYPIFNLANHAKDLKKFLNNLEEVVIDFLLYFGIKGERRPGFTGAWVGNKKIASIGIGVKKWVAYHGIAININNDLRPFNFIRPCGLQVEMISLQQLCKAEVNLEKAKAILRHSFEKVFNLCL